MPDTAAYAWANSLMSSITNNIEQVVYGKEKAVQLVVATLAAEGHVLLEDVPGTGKTSLASALASSVNCYFRRIQFTPDVMPSDINGFSIYNQKTNDFEFRPGAVMANIVLADEINRASPKTQSALLEAMEEAQVTVDGKTHTLTQPFFVIATQNPIEQYGTYPLPEAQIDRFMCQLSIGYPERSSELKMLRRDLDAKTRLRPVTNALEILRLREITRTVHASDDVCNYILNIVEATRRSHALALGSSPRGGLATLALARAWALIKGRHYVTVDDIKELAPYTLRHRLILTAEARAKGKTVNQVFDNILAGTRVPLGPARS